MPGMKFMPSSNFMHFANCYLLLLKYISLLDMDFKIHALFYCSFRWVLVANNVVKNDVFYLDQVQ